MCGVRMLKVVKEDLWEVQSDGTWSRPVVVMLKNCEDTKFPVRMCSVCHSGRHGRENMRGVALFLVITYGYSVVGPSPQAGGQVGIGVSISFLFVESVSFLLGVA